MHTHRSEKTGNLARLKCGMYWMPDGNFPTCLYPNLEIKEAMALGMEYAKKCDTDLLLAIDPDCDRVCIAIKNKAGEY